MKVYSHNIVSTFIFLLMHLTSVFNVKEIYLHDELTNIYVSHYKYVQKVFKML